MESQIYNDIVIFLQRYLHCSVTLLQSIFAIIVLLCDKGCLESPIHKAIVYAIFNRKCLGICLRL